MSQGRTWDRLGRAIGALAIIGLLMTPTVATAQEMGPNTGAVSVTWTNTIVTQYVFRGQLVENDGLIYQPDLLVNFALYEGDGLIQSLDAYMEIWNSIHSAGTNRDATNTNKPWFETDYILGASMGLPEGFALDTFVVFYTYPNEGSSAVTELDIKLGYDDADMMAGMGLPAMNPYVLFANELQDAGGGDNSYWEIGLAPSFTVVESEDAPITLTVPVRFGLSDGDYYSGTDDVWGFASVGLDFSMPVTCIPAEYGAWDASAGVVFVFANDEIQTSGQEDVEVVGEFALTMSY